MKTYLKLLLYSCFFCISLCFVFGLGASFVFYIKNGYFLIPHGQMKRAIVFGFIAGMVITLCTLIFNLIDKFRTPPPSSGTKQ